MTFLDVAGYKNVHQSFEKHETSEREVLRSEKVTGSVMDVDVSISIRSHWTHVVRAEPYLAGFPVSA